jgi:microcystin degradation protein MlrC
MKIVIARMSHETNTFSPITTTWKHFVEKEGNSGKSAIQTYQGTNTPLAAYIDLAHEIDAHIELPLAAGASPSGLVDVETYEFMADEIVNTVRGGCDAVLLDLHGAMVAENTQDGEGTLLSRIRATAPEIPICVTYDLHANLSKEMIENCTALIGYKTYPHIDMYDVGAQVGKILLDTLAGKVDPTIAWGNRPMLPHTLCMAHEFKPMKPLQEMARSLEEESILAASVYGGFPLADVEFAGLSASVVADNDQGAAQNAVDKLLDAAWEYREAFVYRGEPLVEAVARAKRYKEGPIVLLDHADNSASGGTQDVMTVIEEVFRQGLEDIAIAAVWDPEAVNKLTSAGVGSKITLDLGGKTNIPSIGLIGTPLEIIGVVEQITDGEFVASGPMSTGRIVRMGPTAVLDTGQAKIVVVSNHVEPWDIGVFTSVGIDPGTMRYLLLKSRVHWRAAFGSMARQTIPCDGLGVTSSDYDLFKFNNLRRPIYPLDEIGLP